jgi:hypothetical protein
VNRQQLSRWNAPAHDQPDAVSRNVVDPRRMGLQGRPRHDNDGVLPPAQKTREGSLLKGFGCTGRFGRLG